MKRIIKSFILAFAVCGLLFSGSLVAGSHVEADTLYFRISDTVSGDGIHIQKKKGKQYILDGENKKIKSMFVQIGKKKYYADKKGVMVKGWFRKEGKYYYASRSTGVMQKDKKQDGIRLKKNGTAVQSKKNVKKIKTMIQAKKVLKEITKPTDDKETKLKKSFDWVISFPYVRFRKLNYKKKGWESEFANDIFKREAGCCVSEAAAFAFLAKECGYGNVYVGHDTSHAWTEINNFVYDPLFAEAKNYDKYYNCPYDRYELNHAGRQKI